MKLSKKSKAILTSTVSVLGATSIVAPLATMTSCSNNNSVFSYEELADKEYGVTEETYNDLKQQFITKYKVDLENESIDPTERLKDLESKFDQFDEAKKTKKCGFTSLSSSLMNFAKSQKDNWGRSYNIKLERKTRATWAQLDGLFNSWKGSFRQYMLNSDMPASTITRVMQDAQNKFVALKKELQQTCNDACDGLIQAKQKIITCFEDVNKDIGLISASIQLKEFMSQYIIEAKDLGDEGFDASCLDNLKVAAEAGLNNFKVGNILTDDTMNTIFKVTRKDDGAIIPFSNKLIKGYTLLPRLVSINEKKETNEYSADFDFGLVKTSYITQTKDIESLTAHLYAPNDDMLSDDLLQGKIGVADALRRADVLSSNYVLHLTKGVEYKALKEVYFEGEDQKIHFMWDDSNAKNQALEAFYDNAKQDPQNSAIWHGTLSMQSLMNSKIMISSIGNEKNKHKFVSELSSSMNSTVQNGDKIDWDDLSKLFVQNCLVESKTEINEQDSARTVVKHKLYAKFKNTIYKNDVGAEIGTDRYQTECVNHAISEQFYTKINEKFNTAIDYVSFYDTTILDNNDKKNQTHKEYLAQLDDEANSQFFISTVGISMAAIVIGILIYNIVAPWKRASTKTSFKIVSLILVIILAGLHAGIYAMFIEWYYKPIKRFVASQSKIKDQIHESKVIKNLNSSLNETYSLINHETDEIIDKEDFAKKKQNFDKHEGGMTWKLSEYKKYSNLSNVEGMSDFNKLLSENLDQPIDGASFHSQFDGFLTGGKYWISTFVLNIVTAFATLILLAWTEKMEKNWKEEMASNWENFMDNYASPEELCDQGKFTQDQWIDSCSRKMVKELGKLFGTIDITGVIRSGCQSVLDAFFQNTYDRIYTDIKYSKGVGGPPTSREIKDRIGWDEDKTDINAWRQWCRYCFGE